MPRAIAPRRRQDPALASGLLSRAARRVGNFARDEGGAVTVEAVLWLPFFFGLLILITDVSFAFYGKAQAFRIVQNANRAMAVRRPNMDTPTEVQGWVEATIDSWSPNAKATTSVQGGVVTTVLSIPASDLITFESLGSFGALSMTVQSGHYIE